MNIIIERVSVELHVLFRYQALEEAAHIRQFGLAPRLVMLTLFDLRFNKGFVLQGPAKVKLEEPHVQVCHVELD